MLQECPSMFPESCQGLLKKAPSAFHKLIFNPSEHQIRKCASHFSQKPLVLAPSLPNRHVSSASISIEHFLIGVGSPNSANSSQACSFGPPLANFRLQILQECPHGSPKAAYYLTQMLPQPSTNGCFNPGYLWSPFSCLQHGAYAQLPHFH